MILIALNPYKKLWKMHNAYMHIEYNDVDEWFWTQSNKTQTNVNGRNSIAAPSYEYEFQTDFLFVARTCQTHNIL